MKLLNIVHKKRAFALVQVIIVIFLFMSLLTMMQFFLNNSFRYFQLEKDTVENKQDILFLKNILDEEFKIIEDEINNSNIDRAMDFITLSKDKKYIFSLDKYKDRISLGGYRLLEDNENINYSEYLNKKIINYSTERCPVHFYKKIKIKEKTYSIKVTIKYKIGNIKNIDYLSEPIIERIWIKEDV